MENEKIVGYKNVKILTYQIFNISDDKPKFIIREVYRISKNDSITSDIAKYDIALNGTTLNLEDNDKTTYFNVKSYWKSDVGVKKVSFDIIYDPLLFEFNIGATNEINVGKSTTFTKKTNVCMSVAIENPIYNNISLPFKCKLNNHEMI
jgi:hypothetical protein